jgi:SAM-dependent methyltransferase
MTADANAATKLVGHAHGRLVLGRRIEVLAQSLARFMPSNSSVLDVGCGNGLLASRLLQLVPGTTIRGVEVHGRPDCAIPCDLFDGQRLSFPDASFEGCLFVDVLHHTLSPEIILADAARVSRKFVLIKDHVSSNAVDHATLRFMDWVGNRAHGVALPYNYLSGTQWGALFDRVGLRVARAEVRVSLYPRPFSWVFGRGLHFISLLEARH